MISEIVGGFIYPAIRFEAYTFWYLDMDARVKKDRINGLNRMMPDNWRTL